MTQLEELLSYLQEIRGSDLHLKPGTVPHVRVDGQLKVTPFDAPAPGVVEALAASILDPAHQQELTATGETSSGFSVAGLGRFRVAIHRQRGSMAMVVRRVPPEIPDLDELGLPPQLERFAAETTRAALTAAEVGHLVISTVRASGAADTVTRLVDLFPLSEQAQARHSLVATLRGVVNQRLLERADGRGRVAAVEILTGTAKVIDCIADPIRVHELEQVLVDGQYHGMQTLQQALVDLVKDGMVSLQDAIAAADRPEDLRIALTQAGVSSAY